VAACREAGALSFVNDRVDVALAADADGAHVGQVRCRLLLTPPDVIHVCCIETGRWFCRVGWQPGAAQVGALSQKNAVAYQVQSSHMP
jgi:Thiamine monophosphate synthase